MADTLTAHHNTDQLTASLPEMFEFIQRLGSLIDKDPEELPPQLRELLEQEAEVDLPPKELEQLLKQYVSYVLAVDAIIH